MVGAAQAIEGRGGVPTWVLDEMGGPQVADQELVVISPSSLDVIAFESVLLELEQSFFISLRGVM